MHLTSRCVNSYHTSSSSSQNFPLFYLSTFHDMTTRSVTILFYYTHGYDRCPLSSTNKIKHTTTRDNFCSKNCRKRPAQYTGLGEKIADRSMTRKILQMGFSRYMYIPGYQCTVQQCTSLYVSAQYIAIASPGKTQFRHYF